jgi:hypothetical protein
MRITDRLVSARLYGLIKKHHPSFNSEESFSNFFTYLLLGTFSDESNNELVINHSLVKKLALVDDVHGNWISGEFLRSFKKRVLPEFSFSGYSRDTGTARTVDNSGIHPEITEALDAFLKSKIDVSDCVYLSTGAPANKTNRAKKAKERTEDHKTIIQSSNVNSLQLDIINHMTNLNTKSLSQQYNKNYDNALSVIDSLDPSIQDNQRKILNAVIQNPKAMFCPSESGNSCRLFAQDSITCLKREVRKALCKGWWEADLQSSQFAIISGLLQLPESTAFIKSGKSLWLELNEFCGGTGKATGAMKDGMKKIVYSMCYGMGTDNLTEEAIERGVPVKLFEHPLLQELQKGVLNWCKRIGSEGLAYDAFGETHYIVPKDCSMPETTATQIAARIAQSYELLITSKAFEVLFAHGERLGFNIVSWAHDGFTISFDDNRNVNKISEAQRLMSDAVSAEAHKHGITSKLEFEAL